VPIIHANALNARIANMNIDQGSIPRTVLEVHGTFKNAGFEAYLVGGCVRDLLLDRVPKDWDLTTNAQPNEICALFSDTFYENDFGTVGIITNDENPALKIVEVTPYRIEGKYSDSRRPDDVTFADTLVEDLRRRDFTINAMAYEPSEGRIVDLHKGLPDLEKRVLRTVGEPHERFGEDALRMLRAVRFASELDFALDGHVAQAIAERATSLQQISKERIRDEFARILLSDRPMQGIYVAQKLGILKYIAPELEEGLTMEQNQAHSFSVFEHLLRTLQHAADRKWTLTLRLAALFHDVGKPASRAWSEEKGDWTFYGHEVIGARMTKKILTDLRFPVETVATVTNLVRWHMFFSDTDKITLSAVRRLIVRVGREHMDDLVNLRVCDRIGTGRPKEHPFRLRKYMSMIDEALRDPISVAMLKIDGKRIIELGEVPGPRIGWILHALLEEVLDDPSKNTAENMDSRAKELMKIPEAELRYLGEQGKDRRDEAEEEVVKQVRARHHVR